MSEEIQAKEIRSELARMLRAHFPELATDEPVGGADTVERLAELYHSLARETGGRNFDDPVQDAADNFLADGGTASELCRLLAEVAEYAAPQTRPDDGEGKGEYDELAAEFEALAAKMEVVYG